MTKTEIFPEGDFVTTDWLSAHMNDVRILDANWLPHEKYAGTKNFERRHIAGAMPFDQDLISGPELPYYTEKGIYYSKPSVKAFAKGVGALGVENGDPVVVYDDHGMLSAPRAWWLFKLNGHENVRILEGGFEKWAMEGRRGNADRPVAKGPFEGAARAPFSAHENLDWLTRFDDKNFHGSDFVDLRRRDEFAQKNIMMSRNLPFSELLLKDDLYDFDTLKAGSKLRTAFTIAGVDPYGDGVPYCEYGMMAPVFALAARVITNDYTRTTPVYAGSMAEWRHRLKCDNPAF